MIKPLTMTLFWACILSVPLHSLKTLILTSFDDQGMTVPGKVHFIIIIIYFISLFYVTQF